MFLNFCSLVFLNRCEAKCTATALIQVLRLGQPLKSGQRRFLTYPWRSSQSLVVSKKFSAPLIDVSCDGFPEIIPWTLARTPFS